MKRLERRAFMKRAAEVSLGGALAAIIPATVTQAASPPLPDDVVIGYIREKWLALGGPRGLMGRPLTPELTTPDGVGRYNHFEHGSIYWTPRTGAYEVHGWIRQKWMGLGWERSWLGYPISDEVDFDGGRVTSFERGQIYWWPDTGAVELNNVVVHYTGLVCFGETDWDGGSGSDEPYVVLGMMSPTNTWSTRTQIYSDVDGGESRPDLLEIYRGKPNGLNVSVVLVENDHGNPANYQKNMELAVSAAAKAAEKAIQFIPVVGPIISDGVGLAINAFKSEIARVIAKLFGDDVIGRDVAVFTPKEMVILAARVTNSAERKVGYKKVTTLLKGQGASYKVYFGIVPV